MKSRKTKVFAALWLAAISGFSLMIVSAAGGEKVITTDLTNAIQRIPRVQIKSTDYGKVAELRNINHLLRIDSSTYSFVLSDWSSTAENSTASTILWWSANTISGSSYSTIVAWDQNTISGKSGNVVLWGHKNKIDSSSYSAIAWWSDNKAVGWSDSVIVWWTNNTVGGNNSVVLWNESTATKSNSVSLWNKSKNNSESSFLWTDAGGTLGEANSGTFVVVAGSGMVVNETKANSVAQLTIWWSLIIDSSTHNPSCDNGHKWVLKVVANESNTSISCFCTCDGSSWSSLFGGWMCSSSCNASVRPVCDNSKLQKLCNAGWYTYTWGCAEWGWEVVDWTWAYLVDKNGYVHWTCQTNNGASQGCSAKITENPAWCVHVAEYECMGSFDGAHLLSSTAGGLEWNDDILSKLYQDESEMHSGEKCVWVCDSWNVKVWNMCVEAQPCVEQDKNWYHVPALWHGEGTGVTKEETVAEWIRVCNALASCFNKKVSIDGDVCGVDQHCVAQTVGGYRVPAFNVRTYTTGTKTWDVIVSGVKEWYYTCERSAFCDAGTPILTWSESCTYKCVAVTKDGYNVPALNDGRTYPVSKTGSVTWWERIYTGEAKCVSGRINITAWGYYDVINPCPVQTVNGYNSREPRVNGWTGWIQNVNVPWCEILAKCSLGEISLIWSPYCTCGGTTPSWEGVNLWDSTFSSPTYGYTWWTYNSWALNACLWKCADGFERSGNGCTPTGPKYKSCGGNTPSWDWVKTGSDKYVEGSSDGTSWDYIELNNYNGAACTWTCDTGFNRSGNGCTPTGPKYKNCGGITPSWDWVKTGSNKYLDDGTYSSTSWDYVRLSSYSGAACTWTCETWASINAAWTWCDVDTLMMGRCTWPCGQARNWKSLTCYEVGVVCPNTAKSETKTCSGSSWVWGRFTHDDYVDSTPSLWSKTCDTSVYTLTIEPDYTHGTGSSCTEYEQDLDDNACEEWNTRYSLSCDPGYHVEGASCKENPIGVCEWPCGGATSGSSLTCYENWVTCPSTAWSETKTCKGNTWVWGNFTHSNYTGSTPVLGAETCEWYTVLPDNRHEKGTYTWCTKYEQNWNNNSCKSNGTVYKLVSCAAGWHPTNDWTSCEQNAWSCHPTQDYKCYDNEDNIVDGTDPWTNTWRHVTWKCGSVLCVGGCKEGYYWTDCDRRNCEWDFTPGDNTVLWWGQYQPLFSLNWAMVVTSKKEWSHTWSTNPGNCEFTCEPWYDFYTGGGKNFTLEPISGGPGLTGWFTPIQLWWSSAITGTCVLHVNSCGWTKPSNSHLNNTWATVPAGASYDAEPSTSTAACAWSCNAGYDWITNPLDDSKLCKDVDHLEWVFYVNGTQTNSYTFRKTTFYPNATVAGFYLSTDTRNGDYYFSNTSCNNYQSCSNYTARRPEPPVTWNSGITAVDKAKLPDTFGRGNWSWEFIWNSLINSSYMNWNDIKNGVTINFNGFYDKIPDLLSVWGTYETNEKWSWTKPLKVRFNSSSYYYWKANDYYSWARKSFYVHYIVWMVYDNRMNQNMWQSFRWTNDHLATLEDVSMSDTSTITAVATSVYFRRCNGTPHWEDYEARSGNCWYWYTCNNWNGINQRNAHDCTSSGWWDSCFLWGTHVLTEDWYKNIEDVQVWDMVLSYNPKTMENEYNKVNKKFVHEDRDEDVYEFVVNGDVLKATYKHRFYVVMWEDDEYQCVRDEWVAAANLKVWDTLMMSDGRHVKIESINHYTQHWTFYNLWVENVNNYYVYGWYLVHNSQREDDLAIQSIEQPIKAETYVRMYVS